MSEQYQVIMGSYTVEQFANKIANKEIKIAPFQREYKWHKENYPKYYLDSLQRNIFTVPVILAEYNNNIWIIDGQQRLATLFCYIKGKVPNKRKIQWEKLVEDIKNNNDVSECSWIEIDGNVFDKDKIKNTPIGYSLIFNVDHKSDMKTFITIYDRINNQGYH